MNDAAENSGASQIEIHFIKSNFFRVVHGDGVWGGITPSGNIQMAVFSHRIPIPQMITQNIVHKGEVASFAEDIPSQRIAKKGILREMEVDIVFNLETALAVRNWLDINIRTLEQINKTQQINK